MNIVPSKLETGILIELMAEALDADLLLYSGGIDAPGDSEVTALLRSRVKKRRNVVLFLTTGGGSADVAYRIARSLQLNYRSGKVILFVHTYCKSAGTLIALGANQIIMSDEAELGPLDVQVSKRDELGERISGLTPIQAMMTLRREAFQSFEQYLLKIRLSSGFQITTMTAAQIAAKLTNGCFSPIYKQIDPMSLGEHQRAMAIAQAYGQRLDQGKGNLKSHALEQLISGYPSHEFIIDREEAKEVLFHEIREPNELELELGLRLENEATDAIRQDETIIRFLSNEFVTPTTVHGDADEQGANCTGQVSSQTGTGSGPPAGEDGPDVAQLSVLGVSAGAKENGSAFEPK